MEEQVYYTELLEKAYGQDQMAVDLIEQSRKNGSTDEEIYHVLESFY